MKNLKYRLNTSTPQQAIFTGFLLGSAVIGLTTPASFAAFLLFPIAYFDFIFNTEKPEVQS